MDELMMLTCKSCKKGLRIEIGASREQKTPEHTKFLDDHMRHGAFSAETIEFFAQMLLPQGYEEVLGEDQEPIMPIASRLGRSPASAEDEPAGWRKKPPFGMPGEPQSEVDGLLAYSEKHGYIDPRPDWDTYFLRIAKVVASRGTCSRLQVGAVLVRGRKIIATGYNGAPSGARHCNHVPIGGWVKGDNPDRFKIAPDDDEIGDMENGHCAIAEHAERNALLSCDVPKAGSTLYVTVTPCTACLRNAATAGVKRVVYDTDYRPHDDLKKLANEFHITLDSKGPA